MEQFKRIWLKDLGQYVQYKGVNLSGNRQWVSLTNSKTCLCNMYVLQLREKKEVQYIQEKTKH